MKTAFIIAVVSAVWCAADGVGASAETFRSTGERVALVELYTSEGCSSCPPADGWLSALAGTPQLWTDYVPVAFHVDYWDHLGWEDPFATHGNSERQRRYARAWRKDVIHTPSVVLNGSDWRKWRRHELPESEAGAAGVMTLAIGERTASVVFEPAGGPTTKLRAFVAVLGFGINIRVERGENAGRTLRHDFVVLGLGQAAMEFEGGNHTATLDLPHTLVATASRLAVAAWVAPENEPAPIQAVGGWLVGSEYNFGMQTTEAVDMSDKITRSDDEWRELLTAEQYNVTREKGTERAFTGEYYDLKEDGLYLCVACGQALFSSQTKYDSGSGWPSFWEPLEEKRVEEESDGSLGMARTEVLCSRCGAHLGHVFPDGPRPTGLRYCVNSAALKFVRQDKVEPDKSGENKSEGNKK